MKTQNDMTAASVQFHSTALDDAKLDDGSPVKTWEVQDTYSHIVAVRTPSPGGMPTRHSTVYAENNTRPGWWEEIGPVSDRYEPKSTDSIIDMVLNGLQAKGVGVRSRRVRSAHNNARLSVTLVLDTDPIVVNGKPFDAGTGMERVEGLDQDILFPQIDIGNGYGRLAGVDSLAGYYRLVCTNGMTAPAFTGSTVRSKAMHTAGSLMAFVTNIDASLGQLQQATDLFRYMAVERLDSSQIDFIKAMLPQNRHEGYEMALEAGKNTMWSALNYATYLQSHEYSLAGRGSITPVVDQIYRYAMAA